MTVQKDGNNVAFITIHKMYKNEQMNSNFIDIFLLCYGHQYVSAPHVVIFRVISLKTRKQF